VDVRRPPKTEREVAYESLLIFAMIPKKNSPETRLLQGRASGCRTSFGKNLVEVPSAAKHDEVTRVASIPATMSTSTDHDEAFGVGNQFALW
jgi:hypothetical protein